MRAVYNGHMEKGVNNMIEAIEGFRLPRYAQIPDVGLYLEQVVRYVNTHLAPFSFGCAMNPKAPKRYSMLQ